jgi:hypothetical protein
MPETAPGYTPHMQEIAPVSLIKCQKQLLATFHMPELLMAKPLICQKQLLFHPSNARITSWLHLSNAQNSSCFTPQMPK